MATQSLQKHGVPFMVGNTCTIQGDGPLAYRLLPGHVSIKGETFACLNKYVKKLHGELQLLTARVYSGHVNTMPSARRTTSCAAQVCISCRYV